MDEYGITPDQYASGLEHMWITSYLYCACSNVWISPIASDRVLAAALSLFTFDSFCLVSREVRLGIVPHNSC